MVGLKSTYLFILSCFISLYCIGQVAPRPVRYAASAEKTLLKQLQSADVPAQVGILLKLSSINYYKPLRLNADLDKALNFAVRAKELSLKINNQRAYNLAQFNIAMIYIAEYKMDRAAIILPSVNDSTRLNILLSLSDYNELNCSNLPGYDKKAMSFAKQALSLASILNDKEKKICASLNITNINLVLGQFKSTAQELNNILHDCKEAGIKQTQNIYFSFIVLYTYNANFDKALRYCFMAGDIMKRNRDSTNLGDLYLLQSYCNQTAERNIQAIDDGMKSIEAYRQNAGEGTIGIATNMTAQLLVKKKRYQDAIQLLNKSDKYWPPQYPLEKLDRYSVYAYYYKGQKNYKLAEQFYFKVLNTAIHAKVANESHYRNVGDVLVQDHKYQQAKPYLLKAKNFGEMTSVRTQSLVHYYLFLCDSAARNYLPAIKELTVAGLLSDSLKNEARSADVSRLQIQFDTREKERKIKIKDQNITLLKQQNQIEHNNLAIALRGKKETIVGIIVLLLLMAVFFVYYWQKQRISRLIMLKNETITQKNEQLQQLLTDKDWLLKEVHHRVKNNLHTVICLLESQAIYLKDDALKAVEVSQHRIYAMSLIHQKLYLSEDIKTIDMQLYLAEFIGYLQDSYDTYENIIFRLNIEPLKAGVSQAIPIALIINEAVTNAIKYAFTKQVNGIISIELQNYQGKVRLTIEDNGIGIDPKITEQELESLGISLMTGLAADLKGVIKIENNSGTKIEVVFELVDENHSNELLIV